MPICSVDRVRIIQMQYAVNSSEVSAPVAPKAGKQRRR